MESRAYTLIAGIFAVLLGLCLLAAFWWLGSSHTPQNVYRAVSLVPVSGLSKQAAVRFRGVDVGHVESIALDAGNPLAVDVDIAVDKSLQLTKGTQGHLEGQGLTGLSYIELDDSGTDKTPLGSNSIMLGESDTASVMASGKRVMAHAEEVMASADQVLKSVNGVLNDKAKQHVGHLLENLDQASGELQPMFKSSTVAMDKAHITLTKVDTDLDEVRPSLVKLGTTLDEIDRIGATVNEETLPRLHQLAHQLNQDEVSLNRLLNTLDEHPESVIFGKPAARPGPVETGAKQ